MNKKLLVSSFIILALVLSVSVVSASSFGDFWNKITGKATAASIKCNDTDGGINYNVLGTVMVTRWIFTQKYYDSCSGNSANLLERYCSTKGALQTQVYKCPSGCKNGACVSNQTCTDTDGGENYYVKGIVSGYDGNGAYIANISDVCEGSNLTAPISINNLRERICDGIYGKDVFYTCPNGCSDGACITNTNQTCTDSDGGKNYYVLGNATGAAYTGEVNTINDGCIIGGLHDGWLREAVCEGNVATWSDYKCSNGCVKGTCSVK